ncbi:subtilisin-like serine protease [Desulfosporosinus orientis DSM 765]|uniref:Subtilisin-like serine protease n=1 Tax=Desulfosporosinus orientis (strain ATCC 19365 / DSM 765 / NCIMB 8382 / VKM B-1628 / Singapore I) TaxID=768706 RepID=G7WC74_DESOD|nr:S8 family serine peptidase [Desulfosporosinus orientis]AET70692.1 subtilisin-like serine protease [Desulfosporosinus orientis DSM 765]
MLKPWSWRTKSTLLSLGIIGIMLLNLGIGPVVAVDTLQAAANPPESHQVVLSLAEGTSLDILAKNFGAKIVRQGPLNFSTLEFPENENIQEIIQEMEDAPGVLSAEENHSWTIQSSAQTTDLKDPLYEKQWPLINQGVSEAWDQGVTGQGVTIAFVDTGIALKHPDLMGNIVAGYNAITGSEAAGANQDNNGHGTEVAGVAAAERNDVGIVGVAYQAKIMPIKAIGAKGVGYDDDIADGIVWAADHGAKIINLSLGSENGSDSSEILRKAIAYAYDKGCLMVAASGNYDPDSQDNPGVSYPAADSRVLAVTATDKSNNVTDYSATGSEVDLAAPGDYIPTDGWSQLEGSGYNYASGTSLAAPFVSGEAALIWGQHPEWSRDQVIKALEQGTEDLGSPGQDNQYGYGLVDVKLALNLDNQTLQKVSSPARIDAAGGIVEAVEGTTQLDLTIPQQAFKQVENVTVNNIAAPADLPNGSQFLTPAFQVNWGNAAPQQMLSLEWRNPGLKGNFEGSIYRWSGSRWISLGGEISDGKAGFGLYMPGIYVLGTAQSNGKDDNRFAGVTAEETAVQISKETFPTGADTVILAQVNQFPDALAGAPLAYKMQAPILLSQSSELNEEVRAELRRLAPKTVYLLGGTAALSDQIEKELQQTYEVKRLSGYTAEGTARAIALELGTQGKAVIASDSSFQDALVISSWAARQGIPILLTKPQTLPKDTQTALQELKVTESLVIGGTAVVGTKVMEQLPFPNRISGRTAYDTAAAVLQLYPPTTARVEIATGENFPDALTGAVRAAFYGARVVLVPTHSSIPDSLSSLLKSWQGNQVEVLGGVSALPESIVQTIHTWVQ